MLIFFYNGEYSSIIVSLVEHFETQILAYKFAVYKTLGRPSPTGIFH